MSTDHTATSPSHFIKQIIQEDIRNQKNAGRVSTRFPPEPNGYLHLGHAKSICLNFGLAGEFNGRCNLRFDDTNPSKEDLEYVESIQADVKWLGFEWNELRHASDYFETFYLCAEKLIGDGHAYVCDLNAEQVREYRGTLTEPGRNSPYRDRSIDENLDLFRRMRAGEFADGARTLRAKIDMSSGNINLRDPALYRIRKVSHQNTGDTWPIYPMYDYAHCISDAVEGITHSICTLEFEDHRPLYDWCLDQIDLPSHLELVAPILKSGLSAPVSRPQQIEFARGNLDYTVMSKRKLIELVNQNLVDGWDDPRMPTISGLRRRGFPAAGVRLFWERAGISKQNSTIEFSVLEGCVREVLDATAMRRMAVLNPLKVILTNLPELHHEELEMANHPQKPEMGSRQVPFSSHLWIEQDDFMEVPVKDFHRLVPGGEVRFRGVGIVKCNEVIKNANGEIEQLNCSLDLDSRHGLPGAARKVKGVIHWVSATHGMPAEVRLYDRLFSVANPDAAEGDYKDHINLNSKKILPCAWVEPSLLEAAPETAFQFERLGYFVADKCDHVKGNAVFNRSVTLRDTFSKAK